MGKFGCDGNEIEILAPVGGKEQLLAAVRCGADAVYFGLQNFNARRNADNFAGEDLRKTVEYCHEHGVRVFITINTLVKDSELADMKSAVDQACGSYADGLIVQDLAVIAYARERWPQIPLVASTQMAVHNAEGTKLLQQMGFSRAVLARELSLGEIRDIYDQTGMELEAFVHGAHCMSVSGLCYLSSMIGGRSGNRGLCAQPCRLDCSVCGRDYALSLKDLSYIKHIRALAEAGVRSLKIEGRMKRPEYVAASVLACKAAICGEEPDLETLRSVFSRSGFTDGYLTGKRDREMFGHRTKEDVVAAADVLKDLAKLYEKEPQTVPVDMFLYVRGGEPARLCVSSDGVTAEVFGTVPQEARTLALTEEYAQRSLSKTGGTPYFLRSLKLFADDGLMLPASALNELRRNSLEALGQARVKSLEEGGKNTIAESFKVNTKQIKKNESSGSSYIGNNVAVNCVSCAKTIGTVASDSLSDESKVTDRKNALWARFSRLDQLFPGCPETVILPLDELVRNFSDELICNKTVSQAGNSVGKPTGNKTSNQVENKAGEPIGYKTGSLPMDELVRSFSDELICNKTGSQAGNRVGAPIGNKTGSLPLDELVRSFSDELICNKTVSQAGNRVGASIGNKTGSLPEKRNEEPNERITGSAPVSDSEYFRSLGITKIIAEIPSVIWPDHMGEVRRQIGKLKQLNITDVYVENIGNVELAHEFGLSAHGGMCLNILNSEALEEYRILGLESACLSFEMSFSDMRKIRSAAPTGAVTYGYLPLMKFRNCPAREKGGCGKCSGLNYLTDRKNERFPIICHVRQYSELLNCVPLYIGDRSIPPLDHEILYFTLETSEECAYITDLYRKKKPFVGRKTAGLYFRELL